MGLLILKIAILALTSLSFVNSQDDEFLYGKFPDGFMWGLATSAYQIEGGWDSHGKGENTWDFWSHENNGANIDDGKNGDIACDSYNKYLDDVKLLKDMGADFYRFSLAWSRIVPTGRVADGVNQPGIDYYNRLIDALLAEGILPFITLYHWDTPMGIQNDGGWLDDNIVEHFADYARVAYEAFGDRVKWWLTFNEPHVFCLANWNYGERTPFEEPPRKPYICAHNVVKAHARAWRIYDEEFRPTQQGKMGITLNCDWSEPKNRSDPDDVAAMERSVNFRYGWWANPLTRGEYPPIMRELVDAKSEPGASRLPTFDAEWTRIINGTVDFLGLNHYSSHFVTSDDSNGWLEGDANIKTEGYSPVELNGIGWAIVPSGFRSIITWVSKEYSLPVYITENGYGGSPNERLDDTGRQKYYNSYINEVLKAIEYDGADVRSYTAWSLMDNYEWTMGYTARFGVHYVDFDDDNRTRTPKDSAIQLTKIFADNGFPEPSEPEPTQPEPTQPEPTQPEPTQPEPTEPGSQPSGIKKTMPHHVALMIGFVLFSRIFLRLSN